LTEKIPLSEDYKLPIYGENYRCYNCNTFGDNVREIKGNGRTIFKERFWWLCPNCFKKLIIDRLFKEKVNFD
jgi:hypothetical protein